jgi:hypothetical protein
MTRNCTSNPPFDRASFPRDLRAERFGFASEGATSLISSLMLAT